MYFDKATGLAWREDGTTYQKVGNSNVYEKIKGPDDYLQSIWDVSLCQNYNGAELQENKLN